MALYHWSYWYTFCRLFFSAHISVLTPEMERRMEKTIGKRIKECRLALGMTQEEMAEKLCCNKSLISQYENDKVDIKGSVIVELAPLLRTTTGYLLNGEIGCCLDEDEKEMLELMAMLKNSALKKVALEQVRVLQTIY